MLAAKVLPLSSFGKNSSSLGRPPNQYRNLNFKPTPINKSQLITLCMKSSLLDTSSDSSIDSIPPQLRVNIYSESLPFIQRFRGKTIVVKYGGAAMKSESLQSSVIRDLVLLSCVGLRIVFVHGGGPEINHWLTRLNIQPNFLNGLRVTDASTIEIVSMVLVGKVNKHLVSLINKAGATAVGLSGIDGRLLTAVQTRILPS